mgnify:CR=1 FL=1
MGNIIIQRKSNKVDKIIHKKNMIKSCDKNQLNNIVNEESQKESDKDNKLNKKIEKYKKLIKFDYWLSKMNHDELTDFFHKLDTHKYGLITFEILVYFKNKHIGVVHSHLLDLYKENNDFTCETLEKLYDITKYAPYYYVSKLIIPLSHYRDQCGDFKWDANLNNDEKFQEIKNIVKNNKSSIIINYSVLENGW